MMAVGLKGSLVLPVLCYLIWTVVAAPVDEGTSHALQISESMTDGRGCYYNFEHYGEGDRILTNEPCLNCTCHNRMLMCYLRVCPFTKAIGQDCTVEKKPDQCCPVITCPQVPVALLTSSTTSEAPQTTALGRLDNYGCLLEDNTFYADGAQVPSDPRKPCELCYCIRNHTACVMQECTLNVEGCKPVYQEGVCCPVRYDCDYDDVATTPKPTIGLVTTPGGPTDCLHNGHIYHDGAMVMKDEKAPCEHCYCMRGDIVCAVQECGTPLEGTNCTPMEPKHGQCCPNYECTNGTYSTENYFNGLSSSTETLLESTVTESTKHQKPESDESSNEDSSNESSEESKEGSGSDVLKPVSEELSNNHNSQEPSTATEQTEVSNDSSEEQKQPDTNELVTSEPPVQEVVNGQTGDSIPEATQDHDLTHPHEGSHDLGEEQVQDHDNSPKQSIPAEQEAETTQKQEVSQEQDVTNGQEATHKPEEVTHMPESTHAQETVHEQDPTQEQDESTHAQEATQELGVTQATPGSDAVKDQETAGDKEEIHNQDETPAQEEMTNAPDAIHEQEETSSVQVATHEQDVTPVPEEATQVPEVTHEQDPPIVQEAAQEQDVTHVQEEVTHLPEVTHEQDSPIVQEAAHEQDVTHVQAEVTQLPEAAHEQDSPIAQDVTHEQDVTPVPEEATHVPEVTHEQDPPIVQEGAQEQEVTHAQEGTTQLPEVTHEQDSPIVQEAAHEQGVTHVQEEVTHTPEVTQAPQVSHEQETSNVPEVTQEQGLKHKQDVTQDQEATNVQETTNSQENTEQSTAKQEIQTQAPIEVVKDSQVTNEIPESTPPEHSEPSTEEPAVEVARVPGEGSCLVDGKTYAHNSIISSENPCHEECRCYSSIVTCKTKECSPAPTQYEHCEPVITPGSCCPTYLCDQKPSDAPEADSQLYEHTGDASHSGIPDEVASDSIGTTQASIESEHKDDSISPIVEDALQSGSDNNAVPAAQPEKNHQQPDAVTTEQAVASADTTPSNINGDENVNSDVVHGADAAIHGGQPEAMDNKHESESQPQPSEDTTPVPMIPEKPVEETQDTGASQDPETSNGDHTEEAPVKHDDKPMPPSDDVSQTSNAKPEEESASTQEPTVGSDDSEKSHPENPATVNYAPEVTTIPQSLQVENQDSTAPSADNVEAEGNVNYVTSSDSTIDESKHEESIVTIKPTETSVPQESGGANTEHDYVPTEGPVGIPDQSHSQYDNDPEQIQGAILFQQTTESESLIEASTENIAASGDPHVSSVSNEVSEENTNVATEENVPSVTSSPNKHDSDAEANQVSSGSVESDETVTSLPFVTEQVASYETTSKPFEEASSSSSAYEKPTEPPTNQVSNEENDGISHSIEDTTDSVVQTTIRSEIIPSVETSQNENKAQEADNVISSTENEKPNDITTYPPIVNQDDNEKTDDKLENVTPHEKPEETSEENVHKDEVINPEPVLTDVAHPEEKPTQESHDGGEQITQDSIPSETSTEEVKAEQTDSNAPAEGTDTPIHNDENNVHSDTSPQVTFEEVTVTGMPSIESHVTEGTVDHSAHITNNFLDNDIVETTENTAPAKDSSISNEVQTSNEPANTEAPLEPSVETEKTIVDQPEEHNTAPPVKDTQNIGEPHQDTTSSQQEINSSESTGEEAATTQKTNVEESHLGTVNEDESSPDTNEINPTQSVSEELTTEAPIVQDANENSNEVISEHSTVVPNNAIDTEPHESPAPVSDDQKDEDGALSETSPVTFDEPSKTTGEINTEPAKVGSGYETTAIPPVETTHSAIQETNVEDNTVSQPHTDAPLEDEKVNSDDTENNPSEVQTDHKEDSHVAHEDSPVVSHEPTEIIPTTDSILTNDPIQTAHETSQGVSQPETSPEPNQNEVLHHETTEAPVQNQSENTSEEANHADGSINTVKETSTETLHVQTELPSEITEIPSSDTKEQPHEVSTEHVIEPEPEQNATPSSPSADHESSTAHETVVSQTENVLSPVSGSSDEIAQSSGDDQDSTTPQITHLEHAAPPAPDSDSHVLETNESEGESATPAAEQSTSAVQSTISDNNQSNEEEIHHDDVPLNPPEVVPAEPEHVPSEPEHVPTEPQQVPAEPEHIPTEPEHVPAEPEHVPAEPEQVPVEPEHGTAEPEHVPSEPEHVPTESQQVPAEPEQVPAEPEYVTAEPEHVTAQPEHVPSEPENVPTEPQQVPAEPEHVPTEPEQVSAEPEHVPAEPEHVPAEPEHVPAEPEHVPAEPEHVPAEPEHVPTEPEQVSAEPEHVPSEPELVPSEPEHVPTEPEQVSAEPEHVPAETEPVPTEPEQTPAEPERVPAEPEQPIVSDPVPDDTIVPTTHIPELEETSPGFINHESSTAHPETQPDVSSSYEHTSEDIPSSTEHQLTEEIQTTPKESIPETHKTETEKPIESVPVTESTSSVPPVPDKSEEHVDSEHSDDQSSKAPITHSTEAPHLNETPRPTYKPSIVHHEETPSFPTWSQKPFEHHTTPEPHPPEENHYPSGFDPEYEDEEGVSYGPGTCRYGGKVYLSAQQIPRDDPCDFCFCFRSDIICLQQSCPPPIRGCYQETIKGFCCPRYECHVSMATMLNMTTTTTTTTTTLPPHFLAHAYNGAATKAGCQVKDVAYSVGERIPSTSGPCLECRCGANGQMKCDPTVCGPQEALLRQVMDAAISRRR